ncbi:MAG TPA: hypothetical protein VFJ65_01170 [Solirubrobacterales bacterium]|nr:hypothetical protein [Solirubrobacterales bacterium]
MRRLFLAGALLLAMLIPASSALASSHHPTGEFKNFGECPLSNPSVNFCTFSENTSGEFKVGKKTVPLVNPQLLQGGLITNLETFESTFVGAENGETLSKTAQPVPGGLLGIVAPTWWPKFLQDLFNETINNGFTGVTATVELAKPASNIKLSLLNLLFQSGTALSLPAKVKLSNPFLGSSCYIGSSTSPITINFTSGTTSPPPPNKPITGSVGTVSENAAHTKSTISGGRLVDNAFAAPGANGCGGLFSFLIDPFVNEIVGVPSAAGTNTAILEGKIELAQRGAVVASE